MGKSPQIFDDVKEEAKEQLLTKEQQNKLTALLYVMSESNESHNKYLESEKEVKKLVKKASGQKSETEFSAGGWTVKVVRYGKKGYKTIPAEIHEKIEKLKRKIEKLKQPYEKQNMTQNVYLPKFD